MTAQISNEKSLSFILAGNSTFTVKNTKTNNRFTFKVSKHKTSDVWFVSVMTGTDNESSFTFIGSLINGKYIHSKKSKFTIETQSVKVFNYVFNNLTTKSLPEFIEVWHEGKCGHCGRKLTTPESLSTGFGPFCVKRTKKQMSLSFNV